MRTIDKRTEPLGLTEWRSRFQADINYGYDLLRLSQPTIATVEIALVQEQGGLCAYTGHPIGIGSYHVEHLTPQVHCTAGEDVDYRNVVACWPGPHDPRSPYGAHPKADWPGPGQNHLFVSPLRPGCEQRFTFNVRGEISPADSGDAAAGETIDRLKLNHKRLAALRSSAMKSIASLTRKEARKLLRGIESSEQRLRSAGCEELHPYCFAVKQALKRHIVRLDAIRKSGRARP